MPDHNHMIIITVTWLARLKWFTIAYKRSKFYWLNKFYYLDNADKTSLIDNVQAKRRNHNATVVHNNWQNTFNIYEDWNSAVRDSITDTICSVDQWSLWIRVTCIHADKLERIFFVMCCRSITWIIRGDKGECHFLRSMRASYSERA